MSLQPTTAMMPSGTSARAPARVPDPAPPDQQGPDRRGRLPKHRARRRPCPRSATKKRFHPSARLVSRGNSWLIHRRPHDIGPVLQTVPNQGKHRLKIRRLQIRIAFQTSASRSQQFEYPFHADPRSLDAWFTQQGVRVGNNALAPVRAQHLRISLTLCAAETSSPTATGWPSKSTEYASKLRATSSPSRAMVNRLNSA